MLRPVVSKVAEDDSNVDYYYVNVDKSGDLAEKFNVFSIPTMVLLKNGAETNRSVGYIPEDKVKQFAHS